MATIRSLARKLDLSVATVSSALNGSGRVSAKTVQRVRQAAAAAGYQLNPLASAVMSEFRRSRAGLFGGTIAIVDITEPFRPDHAVSYHRDLTRGVRDRAEQLGFATEQFAIGRDGMTTHRLNGIVRTRGIHGIILLPTWNEPDLSQLDWTNLAGIYTDYSIDLPALNTVYPDHYRGIFTLLARLRERGYSRPGLFVMQHSDERLHHRWEAAFLASASNTIPVLPALPCLKIARLDEAEFRAWFRAEKPDVVIGHHTEVLSWMRAEGASIPGKHGFVCLNALRQSAPCAALDLRPKLIGSLALEQLVGHLHRRQFGIPDVPSTITVPPRWVEGPTVRRAAARG